MSHTKSFIIVSLAIASLVGCAAPGPTIYEEWSVSKLIMLKPLGNNVRVTASWLGPQNINAPNGYFTGIIADQNSSAGYILWIPKSLANVASQYPEGSTITVEGQGQSIGPNRAIGGIKVERFVK